MLLPFQGCIQEKIQVQICSYWLHFHSFNDAQTSNSKTYKQKSLNLFKKSTSFKCCASWVSFKKPQQCNGFQTHLQFEFHSKNLDYFQCWNGDGPNLSNLNCQEYEVFGTYRITIQVGFHQVVILRYTPIYPTWAPHCYALLVTIFLLITFSYDYQ